ncbi:ALS2 C-terminal-like protein [Acipenser ruthenus]|uniref:ALS2 C-terminal-like protein n=1 Tax=Acipenser ruthenus TaxID=7906 RepID=A0A444TX67_ACIRT|nr:ALS2 C-terminal-like protein [Acipenser ruthenus]
MLVRTEPVQRQPGDNKENPNSLALNFNFSVFPQEKTAARSLVETDKAFLDYLADINKNVLQHLLHHNTVDQKWHNQMTQLLNLNEKFHALWDQTGKMCKTLKQLIQQDKPVILQDIYIISNKTGIQEVYIQYFSSFTNFVVIGGFDYLAKKTCSYFKKNKVNLNTFLTNSQKAENSVSLYRILHERIREQVNQYTLILTRLYEATHKTAGSDGISDALKGFVDLQKYISQVLDVASLTKALWKSLERKVTAFMATKEPSPDCKPADPLEKMDTLFRTFEEIEKTVSWVLGREYKLPMDDLLPLLIYVVSRARFMYQLAFNFAGFSTWGLNSISSET